MITPTERQLIHDIADRASKLYEAHGVKVAPPFIATELEIVHDKVCALRLAELRDAKDVDLAHDIAGIHDHLQSEPGRRGTYRLDGFSPRFRK
jgi:hypothetical protein